MLVKINLSEPQMKAQFAFFMRLSSTNFNSQDTDGSKWCFVKDHSFFFLGKLEIDSFVCSSSHESSQLPANRWEKLKHKQYKNYWWCNA